MAWRVVSVMMTWSLYALLMTAVLLAVAVWYAIVFPRQSHSGPLPALTSEQGKLGQKLATHLKAVASRPHNVAHYADLEAAAVYIETTLKAYGYTPIAQPYEVDGRSVRNIEAVIEPQSPSPKTPSYVVGAHYDSAGEAPGANDNGTGVAALLELARLFADLKPHTHRIRLVFYVNEEQPYSHSPNMGSWRHAKSLAEKGELVDGMISLETIGYFSDKPGSQKFPFPFGLIYSDRGNFVAFVALPGSRTFLHQAIAAFRKHAAFPSIGGVAPGFIPGIDWSDHWSYHQFGYPALMVTDTAPFRNPYYHRRNDLPGAVDTESLARVTLGIAGAMRDLVR